MPQVGKLIFLLPLLRLSRNKDTKAKGPMQVMRRGRSIERKTSRR